MATTRTYDPALHLASFAGIPFGTSFGKDAFIKASRNEDGFTLAVGVAGEAARAKNNNHSGTVEVTVMANSQICDALSAIVAADEVAGTGVAPFFLKELNGTSVLFAQDAWVKKLPDMERGKEAGEVTFVFECRDLKIFNGGLL